MPHGGNQHGTAVIRNPRSLVGGGGRSLSSSDPGSGDPGISDPGSDAGLPTALSYFEWLTYLPAASN
jgi:hypothetical protein